MTNYALLAPLGRDASARAYLALGGSAVCVLKFPLHPTTAESCREELERWRAIWGAHVKEVTLAGEDVLVLPYVKTCQGTVKDQSEGVKDVARAAVKHMAACGYRHDDCCWRHVGLCYKPGVGQCAVLIDLERVEVLETEEQKKDACRTMLAALGL